MADRTLAVTLSAKVQGFVAGFRQAQQSAKDLGSELGKAKQYEQEFNLVGSAMVGVGLAAAASAGVAAKAAVGWETAWAGVTKTVDGTPDQLARVEEGLRGLSKVLPASHDEIAAVAEAAGQLGIQTDSVVAFTKTMIDLGETTNLSANEAATSLARFMNVMGTSQDQVSNLGSALVELGNNYATTEREILEMSMRLSGAGRQIGLSEGEVLGLATALSSVGIEAEAGGSAISKVMIDIASSVENGGDRLDQFATVAGVSADKFAMKWKTDPGAALALFVKGLSDAESQGGSTLGILEDLGITEVRMRDALLRSAAASDQFTAAMDTGNEAIGANTALTEEAAKRYETVAAKIDMAKNAVVDAAIGFGEVFLPAIGGAAEAVGDFADLMGALPEPIKGALATVTGIGGAASLAGGLFFLATPKIVEFRAATKTLGTELPRTTRVMKGLGVAAGVVAAVAVAHALRQWADEASGATKSASALRLELKEGASAAKLIEENLGGGGVAFGLMEDGGRNLNLLLSETGQLSADIQGSWAGTLAEIGSLGTADTSLTATRDTLKELDAVMAELVTSGNAAGADALFAELAAKTDGSKESLDALIKLFPGYREAQLDASAATKDGASAAQKQADALWGIEDAADDAGDATDDLADKIRNFGEAQFDTEKATLDFYSAVDDLTEALNAEGASLDVTTEAGRNVHTAMLDVAGSTNDYAASVAAMGGSTEEVQGILEGGRQKIIDTRVALGDTQAAAEDYADQLISTPDMIQTTVQLTGANGVIQQINAIRTAAINARSAMSDLNGSVSGSGRMGTFAAGGYTGDASTTAVSGFVHGKEFVSHARATAIPENRRALEFMHAGGVIRGYAGGGYVQPVYAPPAPQYMMAQPAPAPTAPTAPAPPQSPPVVGLTDSTIDKLARTTSGYVRVQSRQGAF